MTNIQPGSIIPHNDLITLKLKQKVFCELNHHQFMAFKLNELGFYSEYESAYFPKYRAGDIIVSFAIRAGIMWVEKNNRSFWTELWSGDIPQNEQEFRTFWNQIESKI